MKSIKDLCKVNEAYVNIPINIYVQDSGSMSNSPTYDIVEQFIKDHSNFKLNIWAVSSKDILKVKSLDDIKFNGPHPAFDEMHKHMQDHIGETCVFFGN
jgi:hypothetical protein